MIRLSFLTLMLSVVAATSCTSKLAPTDASVPLEVTAGNPFDIVLAANQSTGYEWRLVDKLDETVVQFVGQKYKAHQPRAIGSGGLDIWTFQALATGTSRIVLDYSPPGASNNPDQKTTFTIVVR